MKPLLAILALALLTQCNHTPPRAVPVPPPRQSEAIAPSVDKVRVEIGHARDTSILVNAGLENAVKEVERLAAQKSASEKELKSLASLLNAEQARTNGLWKNLSEASITIETLSTKAVAKDLEAYELRTSLKVANDQIIAHEKWQAANNKKIVMYDFVAGWIRKVIIVLSILAFLYLFLRFGLPLLRRFIFPV